jgi:hypothetical protein
MDHMQYDPEHFNLGNHPFSFTYVYCHLLLFSFLILEVCLQKCSGGEQLSKKVERMGFEQQYNYFTYLYLNMMSRAALLP